MMRSQLQKVCLDIAGRKFIFFYFCVFLHIIYSYLHTFYFLFFPFYFYSVQLILFSFLCYRFLLFMTNKTFHLFFLFILLFVEKALANQNRTRSSEFETQHDMYYIDVLDEICHEDEKEDEFRF